jgi:hypothetical protein
MLQQSFQFFCEFSKEGCRITWTTGGVQKYLKLAVLVVDRTVERNVVAGDRFAASLLIRGYVNDKTQ